MKHLHVISNQQIKREPQIEKNERKQKCEVRSINEKKSPDFQFILVSRNKQHKRLLTADLFLFTNFFSFYY
jgi:energy-converting hydrogenase Eha subunit H